VSDAGNMLMPLFLSRSMKFLNSIRAAIGKRMLAKEIEPVRIRQGFNFNSAKRVAIVYLDSDEDFFKKIKQIHQLS